MRRSTGRERRRGSESHDRVDICEIYRPNPSPLEIREVETNSRRLQRRKPSRWIGERNAQTLRRARESRDVTSRRVAPFRCDWERFLDRYPRRSANVERQCARDSAEDVRKLSGFTVSMLCDSFGDTQHKNWARKAFRWCFVCRMSLNLKSNKLNDAKQYCCAQ